MFGRSFGTVTFKDVESPNDLKQRAVDWLNSQSLDIQSVTLDFIQLDLLNPKYKELSVGDVVTVINEELNINIRMRVEAKQIDVGNPEIGSLTLGKQVMMISDWIANPNLITTLDTLGGI